MKLAKFTAQNEEDTKRLANKLIEMSAWFELTPLPFGRFEVAVKPDIAEELVKIKFVKVVL